MKIGGYPLRKYGSQGQQKSFLIALKLAQYAIVAQEKHERPILLLDDLFDKLDAGRVEQLIRLVSEETFGQILISDCNPTRLKQILDRAGGDYALFSVAGGAITQERQAAQSADEADEPEVPESSNTEPAAKAEEPGTGPKAGPGNQNTESDAETNEPGMSDVDEIAKSKEPNTGSESPSGVTPEEGAPTCPEAKVVADPAKRDATTHRPETVTTAEEKP